MRSNVRFLLLCSLLMLTGMRDPFHPPEDRCAVRQLAQWRYLGVVSGISSIGILQDGQKRWHRVRADDRLPVGWRVIAIDEKELVIVLGDACEPKQWQWQREGTGKNENQDNALADDTQPSGVGEHPKAGQSGRR
ncbi:HofP DNA utilization family protein [Enterobacter sp.]|uniref:HofP DNA utilization family protein n=1 Tax=Enterobacter sp. TaxID=42895 RepID=UPI0039E552E6